MDTISLLSLIIGTTLSVAALVVSIYGLEDGRRTSLIRGAKRWIGRAFLLVIVGTSALGFYAFGARAGFASRGEILMLLVHLFNVAAVLFIIFMEAVGKSLEARTAKRAATEAIVKSLEDRLAALAPVTVAAGEA